MAKTETLEVPVKVMDGATKPIKGINSELDKTGKKSVQNTKSQSLAFTELSGAINVATAALAAMKRGYDFAKEGANIQRLTDSGHELAQMYGVSMTGVMEKLSAASLGTVSDMDLLGAASRAMMLNVTTDGEQMAQLFQVAAQRGRAMGVDTTAAFNDIVTGIGRNSPLILDNLGIITKGWAEEASAAGVVGIESGEPVFGITSSATSGFLCFDYQVDVNAGKYTAKFRMFPGSSAPAWGTAAHT